MARTQRITPFLWYDTQAEEAAGFYCSIFPNSRILSLTRNNAASPGETGTVLVADFELDGQRFSALNGGPMFTFTEAVSLVVHCEDQAEVDHYWDRLLDGGTPSACGWLKDRYGLSWQITPEVLLRRIADPDPQKAARVMAAMMQMVKIDIAAIEAAYRG